MGIVDWGVVVASKEKYSELAMVAAPDKEAHVTDIKAIDFISLLLPGIDSNDFH